MKKVLSTVVLVIFLISSLGGCTTTTTGEKTAVGAGLGALVGGLIGYGTTGKGSGALIGAAVGAAVGGLAGYVIGKHEEERYKSVKQVYQENPEFAKKGSKLPATIVRLNPYVSDQEGNRVTAVKTERRVKLCTEYDIAVGSANAQKTVNKGAIVLDNYLVMPDGTETPRSQRHPVKDRTADGYKDCITIENGLPKGIPDGNYTHVASVKLGDKETKKEQLILVATLNGEKTTYASNQRD